MNSSKTRRALGVVVAAAAAVAPLFVAGPAGATTISQSTIDGKHARDMGCRADQTVIYHRLIKKGTTSVGYVDLMYSVHCHAAWAHIHGVQKVVNQTMVPQGHIHRNSDGRNYYCTAGEGTRDCWTKMVWDKGVSSYAVGIIDPNGATNTMYTARTPSY